jgi:hypothetical protein
LIVKREEALAKRDEKRHQEKEAPCASFIELTKSALEIEESNAQKRPFRPRSNFTQRRTRSC